MQYAMQVKVTQTIEIQMAETAAFVANEVLRLASTMPLGLFAIKYKYKANSSCRPRQWSGQLKSPSA